MKRYELTTEYCKYSCEDKIIATESNDGEWVKAKDAQEEILKPLAALYDELGTRKWLGSDESWDLAIDAVQRRIQELVQGKQQMPTKELSKNEVVDWINFYEEGNEIPDDIMVRILYMAQLQSERVDVKKVLTELMHEIYDEGEAARAEFEESDCCEAMQTMEQSEYAEAAVRKKYNEIFGEENVTAPT